MPYEAKDGSWHETRDAAEGRNASNANMDAMGQFAGQAAGPIGAIILLVPGIIASIIGAVFGFFFKFGIVGRVIQSALVGTVIGFFGVIVADSAGVNVSDNLIGLLVAIPCFALPALWYYYFHYFSLKALLSDENGGVSAGMAAGGVASIFFAAATIMWVGCIIILIIQLVLSALGFFDFIRGYDSSKFPSIVYALPFVAAAVVYIKNALSVREEAADIREEEKSPIIGAVLSAVLPFAFLFALTMLPSGTKQSTTEETAIYEQEQAGVVAAKPAWTKKQEKIAAKCPAKSVLIIDAGGNYGTRPLYKEANRFSTPITELKHEEVLTSTGEMLFFSEDAGYIPVEHKDVQGKVTKGWIKTSTGGKYDSHNVEVLIGKTDGKYSAFYNTVPKDEKEYSETKGKKLGKGKNVTVTGEISIKNYGFRSDNVWVQVVHKSDTGWVKISTLGRESL